MTFQITHKDKRTKARIGILATKSGSIETPFFMPVATKASVKYLSSEEIEKIGAKAIISNTFILHLKPGEKIIKKLGGIKKFMSYNGINVTDSGGFQMYSPSLYIKSSNNGVYFRNPLTKEKLHITPEKDMEIQFDLGSDIAMCLDEMPLIEHEKQQIAKAVERTTVWARRCKKHHDKLQKHLKKNQHQLLFGICQGGIHKDLRKKSAKEISKIGFDGYSIGGLALGEPKKSEYKMIEVAKSVFPENKPCYLMGAGEPTEILEAISRGVDMFDSRFPTQNARRGTLFTNKGKLRIFNSKYKTDKKPIDSACDCYACKNYSRAYIRFQLLEEEAIGRHLATIHNLYYIMHLLEQAKKAIKAGKFKEFLKKIKGVYKD